MSNGLKQDRAGQLYMQHKDVVTGEIRAIMLELAETVGVADFRHVHGHLWHWERESRGFVAEACGSESCKVCNVT